MTQPLPTKIKIGAYRFAVKPDRQKMDAIRLRDQSPSCIGHFDIASQEIVVAPEQGPDSLIDTLVHEVLHCCLAVAGWRGKTEDPDDTERIVLTLTPFLVGVLRDNPALVQFITDDRPEWSVQA